MLASRGAPGDWWAQRTDRQRHGILVAAAGVIAALVGVLLLPWIEASALLTTVRGSFIDATRALRDAEVGLSWLERQPLLPIVPVAAGYVAILFAVKAFDDPSVTLQAIGVLAFVGGYFGWIIYTVNRTLNDIALDMLAAGVDAHIGTGAWLTLTGIAVVAVGVLYGTSTSA